MNQGQNNSNKNFNNKVVLENIVGDIPSYIARDDLAVRKSGIKAILDKLNSKIISLQTKMEIKNSKKEEKIGFEIGLERALNVNLSKNGQKQYKMNQFNQMLKEFETVVMMGNLDEPVLRNLYGKTNELEKKLNNLGLDIMTYNRCINYIYSIKSRIAEKLFELKKEYDKVIEVSERFKDNVPIQSQIVTNYIKEKEYTKKKTR